MIKLEIEAENGKDLRKQLEEILGAYGGPTVESKSKNLEVTNSTLGTVEEEAPEEKKPAKKKTRKPYERQPAEEKEEEPETEEQPEEEAEPEEEENGEELKLDTLIPAVVAKSREGKKDKVKDLLGKYGVDRITKLDKQHYKEFYSKLQKL